MKYPDCVDCHYRNLGHSICNDCDEGDQWEPAGDGDEDDEGPFRYEPGTFPIYMHKP